MSQLASQFHYAKARIALVTHPSRAASIGSILRGAGYEVCCWDTPIAGPFHLLIADLSAWRDPIGFSKLLPAMFGDRAAEGEVVIIAPSRLPPEARAKLARVGEVITNPTSATLLTVVSRKLRFRTLAEEVALRRGDCDTFPSSPSAANTGQIPGKTPSHKDRPVLLAGAPSPTILAAVNVLRAAGRHYECVLSAGQALRAASAAQFDVAVFVPNSARDPLFSLSKHFLRSKRRLLPPVLFVAEPEIVAATEKIETIDPIDISSDLMRRIQTIARQTRVGRALTRTIITLRQDTSLEVGYDASRMQSVAQHATRLFKFSDDQRSPVSLIALRLLSDGPHASISEIIRGSARAVRLTDYACAISKDTVLIVCRGLTYSDAGKALQRLEGCFSNSSGSLMRARALCGVATQRPGERFEETLAQVLTATKIGKTYSALRA